MTISLTMLGDSLTLQEYEAANTAAIAAAVQQIITNFGQYLDAIFAALPNEANGDPVPASGAYISGTGAVMYIKPASN